MAELRIDRVGPRDIDLLVVDRIVRNPELARLFLGRGETGPLSLVSLKLWQEDASGKPDVTAVFQTETDRVMLLLADNVAKMVRKGSRSAMEEAGRRSVDQGLCDRYRCCVLAPRVDLVANREELEGFPVMSYELLKDELAGDVMGEFLLRRGIADRPEAYSAKTNERVVAFWNRYNKHVRNVFPDLTMKPLNEKVGFQSTTVHFTTSAPGVSIYHKGPDGVIDVMAKLRQWDYERFEESIRPYLFPGMKTMPKGKDALIYMEVPVIDFSGDFDAQLDDLNSVLESVVQLQEFMEELDYGGMEQILEEGPAEEEPFVVNEVE